MDATFTEAARSHTAGVPSRLVQRKETLVFPS